VLLSYVAAAFGLLCIVRFQLLYDCLLRSDL
jgi:hypothetical protein